MTKIIAFSGKKRSGKNTACNFIYSLYMVNTEVFKDIWLDNNGLICVKKQDDSTINSIDVQKYYMRIGDIDEEVSAVIEYLSPTIKIYSFADSLKRDICMNILGLSYEQCYDEDIKNTYTHIKWENIPEISYKRGYMTARDVMEYVGTNLFRKLYPECWMTSMSKHIALDKPKIALNNDTRFTNEVDYIKKNNGVVVRLTRNLEKSTAAPEVALDPDKYDWSNFNYIIDNENISIKEQCDLLYPIAVKELGETTE